MSRPRQHFFFSFPSLSSTQLFNTASLKPSCLVLETKRCLPLKMRSFSTSARRLLQWLGYPLDKLPGPWKNAATTYLSNGATQKVGGVISAEILFRNDGSSPVHKSGYNPKDPEEIISVRIEDQNGIKKTHHIYQDGTGTGFVGDKRE